jgi:hypothetical protein
MTAAVYLQLSSFSLPVYHRHSTLAKSPPFVRGGWGGVTWSRFLTCSWNRRLRHRS